MASLSPQRCTGWISWQDEIGFVPGTWTQCRCCKHWVINCFQITFSGSQGRTGGALSLLSWGSMALPWQLIELTRPVDAHLEHVEFQALLQRLSPHLILHIFASAVLERRLIFLAEELR